MLTSTSTNRKYQQNSWLSHLSHSHSLTERAWCRHLTASRSRSHPHSSRGTDTHFQVSDSLQQSHGFSCIHYSLAFSSFLPLFLFLLIQPSTSLDYWMAHWFSTTAMSALLAALQGTGLILM